MRAIFIFAFYSGYSRCRALATLDLLSANEAVDWSALLYGAAFSFVSAYLCIYLFLSWIARIGMLPFVIYRLALGAVLLWFVFA